MTIKISSDGGYPEFPKNRHYVIRLVNYLPPNSATANNMPITYSRSGGPNTWRYNGIELTTIIETAPFSTSSLVTIVINTDHVDDSLLSGMKGAIIHSNLAKQNLDVTWDTPGSNSVNGGNLSLAASTGEYLSYLSGADRKTFMDVLSNYKNLFQLAVKEIQSLKPTGALYQYWNEDRTDNILCGTQSCIDIQQGYRLLRIEGYQPDANTPGAIPFIDYWNPDYLDNYGTTDPKTPSGYYPAVFTNGYVFSKYQPNTVPLKLYWSEGRRDMLTVASAEGIAYAQSNNYSLVNSTVGYVYSTPRLYDVKYQRWAYSIELLLNALN